MAAEETQRYLMRNEDALTRMADLLATRLGLHFPAHRLRDLERGLDRAARETGREGADEYANWFLSSPATRPRLESLARHLTVGETYFFRNPELLATLEEQVLPELIEERRQSDRRLGIWSAGCCSGEEPYTIAMLLDRLIPDQSNWSISILATDINPAFLAKAREGVYGEWSLRATTDETRRRYFRSLPGRRFELRPDIRKRVEFASLNLAEDAYPSRKNGTEALDLILCRNVLMYFTQERAREVAERFHGCLRPGGWLATSPTEASRELFARFETVSGPNSIIFRKRAPDALDIPSSATIGSGEIRPLVASSQPATVGYGRPDPAPHSARSATRSPRSPAHRGRFKDGQRSKTGSGDRRPPSESSSLSGQEIAGLVDAAREQAGRGRLDEALENCLKAIDADKLTASHRYLLATIELERGRLDEAAQALIKAIYLDPDEVLPHVALGNLRLSQERHGEAERHFDTALRLLRRMPGHQKVPESDGLTAQQVKGMVETARELSLPGGKARRWAPA
jgi:chemotaxis protein methyltransferase CheR